MSAREEMRLEKSIKTYVYFYSCENCCLLYGNKEEEGVKEIKEEK